MLSLFILVPLAGLLALNLPVGKTSARLAAGVVLVLALAQAVVAVTPAWGSITGHGPLSSAFVFALSADALARLMLLLIGLVTAATAMVGLATISGARQLFHFMNVLLIAVIGMNGLSLVSDLFSLYVFLEITSIASFILIALDRSALSLEGTFKYIILSSVASVMMLGAVALLLLTTHSTGFAAIAEAIKGSPTHVFTKIAVGSFLCGLFIKAGLVPFHGWVVAAYSSAPAATSVLLAGIATKISGVYTLIRLVVSVFGYNEGVNQVLLLIGAVSAVIGALAALGQTDLKKLLAYSSISQVGYILLGLGCGSQLGLLAAVFHFFNHAIFKAQLFVNSAALEDRLGTTDMSQMGGLGPKMPWTSVTSVLGALSTAGVPPLAGFWSKLLIIIALWKAGLLPYALLAIAVSVLTLAYMLIFQRRIFFGQPSETLQDIREARLELVLPAVVLAAITVGVGVTIPFMPYVLNALGHLAAGVFPH